MTLEKMEEVFVPNIPKYNNLLHMLHNYYKMRDTFTSLQPIFQIVQSHVSVTFLQRVFGTARAEFWETERGLSQEHIYLQ